MATVDYECQDDVAVLWVDNPPVNALSHAVREGLVKGIEQAEADPAAKAVVIAARGRTFMAGADIREFGQPPKEPFLPDVVERIEVCSKPVVAAIHGTALGGGLEIAMGCHYRVAVASARLGLPEVTLGLIPGAEGTQRLPRLVGVEAALEMIVTGQPVPADKAAALGLVDRVVEDPLVDQAVAFARALLAAGKAPRRTRDLPVKADHLPADFFDRFRARMHKRIRGQFAPEQAIAAVKAAIELPFAEGVKRERELFMQCMAHPQSAALRHAFFAEREVAKIPDLPADVRPREIARVGVVGGGTMGSGIATACIKAGLSVTMVERDEDAAAAGLARVHGFLEHDFKKGRIDEAELSARKECFQVSTDYAALSQADLIIEAVFENMDVKKDVFRRLDTVAKPGAILATNTSYLNIDEIASVTGRPADVLGLHFFSPAHIMRLLEIVRAAKTADDVLATALAFAKRIKKVGVVARVCHGFIGNRMLSGYIRQAGFLLLEGVPHDRIDKAIYDFGFPMGPFQMGDLAGLDIGYLLRQQRQPDPEEAPAFRVHDRLVEAGAKGQKTGKGFYIYGEGAPKPNPMVAEFVREEAAKAGIARREVSDEEIIARCVLPLINEGARILEEGIAIRASDIDVVWLYGYGFPRWRGGPMYYADSLGLDHVLDRIRHYGALLGPRFWTPAPLLEKLVAAGESFRDYDRRKKAAG